MTDERREDRLGPTLTVSEAVLGVAELSVDEVLQRLVDSARELAGAKYAALGLPDGDGGFRRFLDLRHERRADRLAGAAAAPARRARGDARERDPYRTGDIHDHPASAAGGRPAIPTCARSSACRSSRRRRDRRLLPDREGRRARLQREDEELIGLLAAHAAIAIANARLHEETASSRSSPSGTGSRSTCTTRSARSSSGSCSRPKRQRRCSTATRPRRAARRPAPGAGAGGARRARARSSSSCARRTSPGRSRRRAPQARRGAAPARPREVELDGDGPRGEPTATASRGPSDRAGGDAERAQDTRARSRRRQPRRATALVLEVEDDGVGFDPGDPRVRSRGSA